MRHPETVKALIGRGIMNPDDFIECPKGHLMEYRIAKKHSDGIRGKEWLYCSECDRTYSQEEWSLP